MGLCSSTDNYRKDESEKKQEETIRVFLKEGGKLDHIWDEFDKDNSGYIEKSEFEELVYTMLTYLNEYTYPNNATPNKVTLKAFTSMMIDDLMIKIDKDNNDRIDKEEFQHFGELLELMYADTIQHCYACLTIELLEAKDLKSSDLNGSSDPYCELIIGHKKDIKLQHRKKKSKVIKKNLNPKWNEHFEFPIRKDEIDEDFHFILRIKDWDRATADDTLGEYIISLKKCQELKEKEGWESIGNKGEINFRMKWVSTHVEGQYVS